MKSWFIFLSRGGADYDDEEEDAGDDRDEAEKEFIKRLIEHVSLSIAKEINPATCSPLGRA